MKSLSLVSIVLIWLAWVPPAAAQAVASQPASLDLGRATIAAIKGEVALRAADGAALPPAKGLTLAPGTVLETKKGSIVLDLADGSQAQVKSNTRVVLRDPAKDNYFSLELFLGKVITKIKKRLGMEPSFRMGTPTAVITVRGTEFLTQVDKKQTTEVYVYEGVVEVAGVLPGSRSVFVRPGFWTQVQPHRPPRPSTPIDMNQRIMRSSEDQPAGPVPSDPSGEGRTQDSSGQRQQPSSESGEHEKPD